MPSARCINLLDSAHLFTYISFAIECHLRVIYDAGLFLEHAAMPHDRELMALTGLRATHAVCTLVERFIDHILLAQEATSRLLPGSLLVGLPVLGTVAAGFPSPADEELTDTMSLDAYLIRNRDATYVLKVTGTSMRDAGILPGDLLLVERAGSSPATAISSSPRWTVSGP